MSRKDQVWWSWEIKKENERKVWIRRRHVTFVTKKVIGRRTANIDKSGWRRKGQIAEADVAECVSDTYVLTTSIDNTSTDKSWILDFSNVKKDVQLLVCKRGRNYQMVNDSTCEVISTGTVNVTCRDETMRALEVAGMSRRHDTI